MNKKYVLNGEIARLDEEDSVFMHEVFKNHKHYQEKFKEFEFLGIGEFSYKEKKSKCFFVCSQEAKKLVDISYLKTVQYLFENLRVPCESFTPANLRRISLIINIITKLLKIYPLSKENFMVFLAESFPHKRKSETSLQLYLFALLKISLVFLFIYVFF